MLRRIPPPLQGVQRPQRGRVGVGVSDIAHEPKFCFFNYLLPSPQPSLAARAVPVPRGEGAYRRFALLQFATQVLNLGDFKFIPLYARPAEKNPPKYPLPRSAAQRGRDGEGVAFWWRARNLSVSISISEPLPPHDHSPSARVLMNPTPTGGGECSFTYT